MLKTVMETAAAIDKVSRTDECAAMTLELTEVINKRVRAAKCGNGEYLLAVANFVGNMLCSMNEGHHPGLTHDEEAHMAHMLHSTMVQRCMASVLPMHVAELEKEKQRPN